MELKVKIKERKEKTYIYARSIGDYSGEGTGKAWEKVWGYVKAEKLFSFGMESIGISHDDPNTVEVDKRRYDACVTMKKEVKPHGDIGVGVLKGGRYAIFTHVGPYSEFQEVYNQIFNTWLPKSGEKLREDSCFEKYHNDPAKTKPEKLKTDIFIPIV